MPTAPQDRPDQRSGFEPWELDLVRSLVFDFLAEHAPPRDVEFDDLAQECLQHWWSQRDRYDETRSASRETFLRSVVQAKLRDLTRGWRAAKRGLGQRPLSLDAPMSDDDPDGPTLGEMLPSQERLEADLAGVLDLRQITSRLSERQQKIIAGVTAGMSKTDLSRRLGISRDALHSELRRIQQIFRKEGLAKYLE